MIMWGRKWLSLLLALLFKPCFKLNCLFNVGSIVYFFFNSSLAFTFFLIIILILSCSFSYSFSKFYINTKGLSLLSVFFLLAYTSSTILTVFMFVFLAFRGSSNLISCLSDYLPVWTEVFFNYISSISWAFKWFLFSFLGLFTSVFIFILLLLCYLLVSTYLLLSGLEAHPSPSMD